MLTFTRKCSSQIVSDIFFTFCFWNKDWKTGAGKVVPIHLVGHLTCRLLASYLFMIGVLINTWRSFIVSSDQG